MILQDEVEEVRGFEKMFPRMSSDERLQGEPADAKDIHNILVGQANLSISQGDQQMLPPHRHLRVNTSILLVLSTDRGHLRSGTELHLPKA